MNYPLEQLEKLETALKRLAVHIDVKQINPSALHFIIFQQYSEGQKHNWLYCIEGGAMKREHQLTEQERQTAVKLFTENWQFDLYPENCNDNHIETAVKKAIKNIYKTEAAR
jgi:hypothetical protein